VEGLLAPWHLLVVFVVALLVFGPNKLPEIGRQVGRGLREFRKFRESLDDDIRGFLGHDDEEDHRTTSEQGELPPGGGSEKKPPLPESRD
jgi:TatA/E family protein of Tat protein translocase